MDENTKPWLLEVNHTPSFTTDSALDWTIKKNLLTDTIYLAFKGNIDSKVNGGLFRIFPSESQDYNNWVEELIANAKVVDSNEIYGKTKKKIDISPHQNSSSPNSEMTPVPSQITSSPLSPPPQPRNNPVPYTTTLTSPQATPGPSPITTTSSSVQPKPKEKRSEPPSRNASVSNSLVVSQPKSKASPKSKESHDKQNKSRVTRPFNGKEKRQSSSMRNKTKEMIENTFFSPSQANCMGSTAIPFPKETFQSYFGTFRSPVSQISKSKPISIENSPNSSNIIKKNLIFSPIRHKEVPLERKKLYFPELILVNRSQKTLAKNSDKKNQPEGQGRGYLDIKGFRASEKAFQTLRTSSLIKEETSIRHERFKKTQGNATNGNFFQKKGSISNIRDYVNQQNEEEQGILGLPEFKVISVKNRSIGSRNGHPAYVKRKLPFYSDEITDQFFENFSLLAKKERENLKTSERSKQRKKKEQTDQKPQGNWLSLHDSGMKSSYPFENFGALEDFSKARTSKVRNGAQSALNGTRTNSIDGDLSQE